MIRSAKKRIDRLDRWADGQAAGPTGTPPMPEQWSGAPFLRRFVTASNPVLFDVGGHFGESIAFYRALFPGAVIHSFEPDPEAYARLVAAWGRDRGVILNNVAVGDRAGAAALHRNTNSSTNSFAALDTGAAWVAEARTAPRDTIQVELVTLDEYCAARQVERVHHLKIDVQGYEPECLAGAADILKQQRVDTVNVEIIFERFYERPRSFLDVEQHLIPFGYRLAGLPALSIPDIEPRYCDAYYVRRSLPPTGSMPSTAVS